MCAFVYNLYLGSLLNPLRLRRKAEIEDQLWNRPSGRPVSCRCWEPFEAPQRHGVWARPTTSPARELHERGEKGFLEAPLECKLPHLCRLFIVTFT